MKKLYFIQVSCQFYQIRAIINRYFAVKERTDQLGDESPLDYYSHTGKYEAEVAFGLRHGTYNVHS